MQAVQGVSKGSGTGILAIFALFGATAPSPNSGGCIPCCAPSPRTRAAYEYFKARDEHVLHGFTRLLDGLADQPWSSQAPAGPGTDGSTVSWMSMTPLDGIPTLGVAPKANRGPAAFAR